MGIVGEGLEKVESRAGAYVTIRDSEREVAKAKVMGKNEFAYKYEERGEISEVYGGDSGR